LVGGGKRWFPGDIAVLLDRYVDSCVWVGLSIYCFGLCDGLKLCLFGFHRYMVLVLLVLFISVVFIVVLLI